LTAEDFVAALRAHMAVDEHDPKLSEMKCDEALSMCGLTSEAGRVMWTLSLDPGTKAITEVDLGLSSVDDRIGYVLLSVAVTMEIFAPRVSPAERRAAAMSFATLVTAGAAYVHTPLGGVSWTAVQSSTSPIRVQIAG
jgi:hypothetical protein